jgi:hypothetical protein
MSTEQCVRAAVIGESASGKSEFIRSLSKHPELIESVGEGQTTRSYAEYDFVVTQDDKPLVASIWLLSEKEFVRRRVEQVNAQLLKLDESEEVSLPWIVEQIREYTDDINNIFLYSTDFFDIKEFCFLSETLVTEIRNKFESMCDFILSAQENDISVRPPAWMNDLNKNTSYFDERLDSSPEVIQEDPDSQESRFLEKVYETFFAFVYQNICPAMDDYLCKKLGQELREKDAPLFFNITFDNKDVLALFLKVIKSNEQRSRLSLSGMVSKIKISGSIGRQYYEEIKDLGINSVLLVDTYGLDHEQSPDTEYLENRYQQIFNNDYPDLAAVLFIKKIQSSADTTFSNELKALYTVKPNLMTYVVGTHIDEQDPNLLKTQKDWLLSKKKGPDYPAFGGKVMELIYDNVTIANGLKRNKVPASLADNRLEVMRSRFAPFCGKTNSLTDKELICIMKDMNIVSVSSVISSIFDREHLGSGYINIDALCAQLEDTDTLIPFAQKFIENVIQRFHNLYSSAGPRTKWRIRVNLEEKKVLGYHGSMTDATWYRAFNDAYNLTFTKQILIETKRVTLSDKYNLQGNEKLAFDELMTGFFLFAFRKGCQLEERLSPWQHELNCSRYPGCCEQNTCMWSMLLDRFYTLDFKKYNQSNYNRVVDWLNANHDFSKKCDDSFYLNWSRLFLTRMNDDFIKLCRNHNLKVAAKKAKRSTENFIETKEKLYQEYKNFDSQIELPFFFNRINTL